MQAENDRLRLELVRVNALYEADHRALLELAARPAPAEGIIHEVMEGFRSVMAPTPSPEPARIADLYGIDALKDVFPPPDPAWEIPEEWGDMPDGLVDADERERAEDA